MGKLTSPILREIAGAVLNAPAVNNTTVIRFPRGKTYFKVVLELTKAAQAIPTRAEMEAAISAMRFVVSGDEIASVTGLQAIAIFQHYSEIDTTTDGRITLYFERPWMNGAPVGGAMSMAEVLGPSLGTKDQSAFDIEIDWSGTSTIVAAKAYALIGQTPEAAGKVITLKRVSMSVAATGVFQFPDLPAPRAGDYLYALHIFTPVYANLTRVAYLPDEQRLWDVTPGVATKLYQEEHPPRTPQSAKNVFCLDFCTRGLGGDAIDLGQLGGHVLETTWANAAPGVVPVVCEIASDIDSAVLDG